MKIGNNRIAWVFLAVALLVSAVQMASYFPRLPEKLATHFDAAGNANGWMNKTGFFQFQFALLGFLGLVFSLLPQWLSRIPDACINLPHKAHWLAPERRAASLADLARQMSFLSLLIFALLVIIGELTLRANLLAPPRLGGEVWWLLGGYGVLLVIWIVRLYRRFPRPPGG